MCVHLHSSLQGVFVLLLLLALCVVQRLHRGKEPDRHLLHSISYYKQISIVQHIQYDWF